MVPSSSLNKRFSNVSRHDFVLENRKRNEDCFYCRAVKFCLPALCLSNSDANDVDRLIDRRRILNPGAHLIRKSDPQIYLYAMHSGCCKGYYVDHNGKEHVSSFYYPGDIMGLESIFFGKFLVDIVALETSDICYINLEKFKQMNKISAETQSQLINIFSQQLWQSYSLHGAFSALELVVQFLLNLSHHAKNLGESEINLKLSMGRHDIGNFLGLSSETVSRVMTRLKNKRLIEVDRNQIKICDLNALKSIANADN